MKKIFIKFYIKIGLLKASYYFWLFGPYGVCNILKNAHYQLIQPLLLKYGATIGKNCVIDTGIQIHRPDKNIPFKNLVIGDKVYVGHNMLIDLTERVYIGNDCGFGTNCQIWTHTGDFTFNMSDYKEKKEPVMIGKSVVCYSGVIISCGVNINNYARVGAGSVVNRDISEMEFAAGIPAKALFKRNF